MIKKGVHPGFKPCEFAKQKIKLPHLLLKAFCFLCFFGERLFGNVMGRLDLFYLALKSYNLAIELRLLLLLWMKIQREALKLLSLLLKGGEHKDSVLPNSLVLVDIEDPAKDIQALFRLCVEDLLHGFLGSVDRVAIDKVLAL